jgi:hypothetical protein
MTVIEKEQVAVLPAASWVVQVTIDVPKLNADPDGGAQTAVPIEQLSTIMGDEYCTTTELPPRAVEVEMLPEHVVRGAIVSATVTLKEQLGPAAVAQETSVTPSGKNELDGGVQVTPPQGPVVVGTG